MKKTLLVLFVALATLFSAQAQLSGNLLYTRASSTNIVGANFIYLFGQEALKIGPMIGVSKPLVSGSSLSIDYGAQMRYYLTGDTQDGGFYPELDLLGGRVNSTNNYAVGFGAGFTSGSGADFGVRWETGIKPSGGKAITVRLGVFF